MRAVLLALVLVPTALLALKIFTGIGPSLPGPRVREALGIVDPFAPCTMRPGGVKAPAVPVSASATAGWRREADVQVFADEEIRAVELGGVVYAGSAVRPNKDGSIFAALGTFYAYQPGSRTARRLPDMPVRSGPHRRRRLGRRGVRLRRVHAGTCHESCVALLAGHPGHGRRWPRCRARGAGSPVP